MNEIKFTGVETIDSESPTHECDVQVITQGQETNVTNKVNFANTLTPKLDSITPRFGTVVGNTTVKFTGSGFSTVLTDNTIVIDGIKCNITAASETEIDCITNKRPGLRTTSLDIQVANKGRVALQQ